jgi:acyl phosphate:glycerol-3-phosphate acyltransferase
MSPFVAYLLGSIPFGYLIVKWRLRADVRAAGSGNIGASNVTRVAGKEFGALTLLLDAAKGCAAVMLAARGETPMTWVMLAAVCAVVGHMFPVWLHFHGGKGVATGLGVLIPVCPVAIFVTFLVWLITVLCWRYVSLGSIVAAALMPALFFALYAPGHAPPFSVTLGTVTIAVLIIIKHRSNIQRLLSGQESRVTFGR